MSWKGSVRRVLNSGLEPAGFCMKRFMPELRCREMESQRVRQRQLIHYRNVLTQALTDHGAMIENFPSDDEVGAFADVLLTCPIRQDGGGGGFSAGILLWTLAKAIKPDLVIESGVFRGFSTWVLRQACPQAKQYAFDITFVERQRVEDGVAYHSADWMTVDLSANMAGGSLVYFDDHVDQWRRIREAAHRGFTYLIFDDSLPSTALHNDGFAAVPTIDMLFEPELTHGEQISWRTECGAFSYRFDENEAAATRSLVATHVRLPDLRYVFGYAPANLTLVVLARPKR
jgi:hypothetical protein